MATHKTARPGAAYSLGAKFSLGALLAMLLAAGLPARGAASFSVGADAVVLVNSASPRYLDFQHFIQPYLDNFGVAYMVQDIATNGVSTNIGQYALIIIGHRQLDTNHAHLDGASEMNLSLAVLNGTGLVNFDSDLSTDEFAQRYQFTQDIFGFSYGPPTNGTNAVFPPTEAGGQMHYVTSRHPTNESITLSNRLSVAGLNPGPGVSVVALSGGRPLILLKAFGRGRALQWSTYDWMSTAVHGPVNGLDDLVWRGLVWAARKPFVMRGLPNFVAMRVDDAEGPFGWLHIANEVGFKPYLGLFISEMMPSNVVDLRILVTNGNATAAIHSFTASYLMYFDHQRKTNYSDAVISNNFFAGAQWHLTNGIPSSKCVIPHYSEIGPNAFVGLRNLGVEYLAIEVVPGTIEYGSPPALWLQAGPYRRYEAPQAGESNLPLYYADFLSIPGHPELEGQFFDRYTEIRNTVAPGQADCGEWCPNNDVANSILRATRQIKRALDSQVLASLFTHEWYIHPTSCCGGTTITTTNWRAILQGITNNLAAYEPIYVTTDFADQYVRATHTSRLFASQFDLASGRLTVSLTGKTDLATSVQVFIAVGDSISNTTATVPAFNGSVTITAATLPVPPVLLSQPSGLTNPAGKTVHFSALAGGIGPFAFQWLRNGTNILEDGSKISGATTSSLTLVSISGADTAAYSVMVSNANGSITSAPAILLVMDPAILSPPASRTNHAGTTAIFETIINGTMPAYYYWLKSGMPIRDATNSVLSLPFVSPQQSGPYQVLVSNAYGSALSSTANLAVVSPLRIESLGFNGRQAFVTWSSIPGQRYGLQFKDALSLTNWTQPQQTITAAGFHASSTNSTGHSTQRFFRVLLVP